MNFLLNTNQSSLLIDFLELVMYNFEIQLVKYTEISPEKLNTLRHETKKK